MKQASPEPKPDKWIRIPVPEEAHRYFKAQAYREGRTMTDLIREYISAYVRRKAQ